MELSPMHSISECLAHVRDGVALLILTTLDATWALTLMTVNYVMSIIYVVHTVYKRLLDASLVHAYDENPALDV